MPGLSRTLSYETFPTVDLNQSPCPVIRCNFQQNGFAEFEVLLVITEPEGGFEDLPNL